MTRNAIARAWPYATVAAVAGLVFARGPFSGYPLYFRDLSLYFFPLRRFVLAGLREGAFRFWNPYVHEGEPLALPPVSYPFDLLQLLRPDEVGISFLLALHVPLAAVWMMALARRGLGLSSTAAAGAGLVYALGGFALSTVNLYVYVQALAWAPAAVLGLLAAARGDRRAIAAGGLAVGVLLTTTAAEVIGQAIVIGVLLAFPCRPAALARMALALLLGAALSAPSVAVLARIAAASGRAGGLPIEVVLSHSIHPITLLQIVSAGFHGDTMRITESWWGANFFPRGFPYFLSLYIGLATLVTAAIGAVQDRGPRRRLAAIAAIALLLALGRWGITGGLVEAFEALRRFRYPVKAFFSVHFAIALLAGLGVETLAAGVRTAWHRLGLAALAVGVVAASAPLWPSIFPAGANWCASRFFPPEDPWHVRLALLDWVLRDAAMGGAVVLAVGGLALLVWRGRVAPRPAALGVVGLLTADLLRAGAGLNPATAPDFFNPSPEVARHHPAWRAGGRVFTCYPVFSPTYLRGRAVRSEHERWTFALLRDTASPWFNVAGGLRSALSPDLTRLGSSDQVMDASDAGCGSVDRLIARLRLAGVGHVVSVDPLSHPELTLRAVEQPRALEPLTVFVYALRDPLPMVSLAAAPERVRSLNEARARVGDAAFDPRTMVVLESDTAPPNGAGGTASLRRHDAGHVEILTAVTAPAVVVVREAFASGWKATVDGERAAILRANGRHMAVPVAAGTHALRLDYDPPGLRAGVRAALAGALVTIMLAVWPRRRRASPPPSPPPPP